LPGVSLAERSYSERTQELIDTEVGELLRLSFERAMALLEHNRRQLLSLAALLRDKEVLEGDELRAVLEGAEAPPSLQSTDEQEWAQAQH
jgi:cell division protease FtsH